MTDVLHEALAAPLTKKHKFKINFKKFLANYYDILKLKYDIELMKRFCDTQFL